jgi:hypothetical protein
MLDFDLSEISPVLFGFLLVIMVLLRPEGLVRGRPAPPSGAPSASPSARCAPARAPS